MFENLRNKIVQNAEEISNGTWAIGKPIKCAKNPATNDVGSTRHTARVIGPPNWPNLRSFAFLLKFTVTCEKKCLKFGQLGGPITLAGCRVDPKSLKVDF